MKISRTPWITLLCIAMLSFCTSCSNVFHDMNNTQLFGGQNDLALPVIPLNPRIEYVYPSDGNEDSSLNKAILISLNKSIAADSIPEEAITIVNETTGEPVAGTFHLYDRRLMIFNPTPAENTFPNPEQKLANQTWYRVSLVRPLKDLDGLTIPAGYSWRFKTGDSFDTIRPVVNDTFPRNGSLAGPDIEIRATLSENIDPASLTPASFTVVMRQSGQPDTPVSGTLSYQVITGGNASRYTAIFRPNGTLPLNREFRAQLSTGIADLAGMHLDRDYSWCFSTGSIVTTLEPAGNASLGAGTFGAPSTQYGYMPTDLAGNNLQTGSLASLFDHGTAGPFSDGKLLRIVVNGKNITDPTGLNLKPTFKRLFMNHLMSPPADRCYIDTVNGIFVIPRPVYWSKLENWNNAVQAEICDSIYAPIVVDSGSTLPNYTGTELIMFNNGVQFGYSSPVNVGGYYWVGRFVYPLGKNDLNWEKGTVSAWAHIVSDGFWDWGSMQARGWVHIVEADGLHIYLQSSLDAAWPVTYVKTVGLYVSLDGNTATKVCDLSDNVTFHVYAVWDRAKGLADGKSLRVFIDGVEQYSTTADFTGNLSATQLSWGIFGGAGSAGFGTNYGRGLGYMDNIKFWQEVVTEDPSFEYNGGAGNENGPHVIYGPANNYVPDLTGPGNGVGYYYVPTE